jgi:hypothetical protein
MSTFDARTTGRPDTWVIRRDGIEVGMISFIPGAIALPTLQVEAMVRALNHPPGPERFRGPGGAMIEQRRARAQHPASREPP